MYDKVIIILQTVIYSHGLLFFQYKTELDLTEAVDKRWNFKIKIVYGSEEFTKLLI